MYRLSLQRGDENYRRNEPAVVVDLLFARIFPASYYNATMAAGSARCFPHSPDCLHAHTLRLIISIRTHFGA